MKYKRKDELDYIKANRKGSRDAELEDSTGWIQIHKCHRSKKIYSRKRYKKIRRMPKRFPFRRVNEILYGQVIHDKNILNG